MRIKIESKADHEIFNIVRVYSDAADHFRYFADEDYITVNSLYEINVLGIGEFDTFDVAITFRRTMGRDH